MIQNSDELDLALKTAHEECLQHLNGSLNDISPPILYHYTNLNSCLSILEHSTLRFTDVRYCNDPEEIDGGLRILNKLHEELSQHYLKKSPFFAQIMDLLVGALGLSASFNNDLIKSAECFLERSGLDLSIASYNKCSIFVACFSEKGDDLRQWMPYANDGKGVALGFRGLNKTHDITEDSSSIIKVCYKNSNDKETYIKNIYERGCSIFENMDSSLIPHFGSKVYGAFLHDLIACKSENYQDEAEWRLICLDTGDNLDKLKFRVSDEIIKPSIDIKIKKESLLQIISGPKVENVINLYALKNVVKKFEYPKVEFKKSSVSYR